MGTFHDDHGELHGITVVVETTGSTIYVGRCHEENDRHVVLLDADSHDSEMDERTREEYLQQAAKFGVWKKHDTLVIPREDVASIRRLGELAGR